MIHMDCNYSNACVIDAGKSVLDICRRNVERNVDPQGIIVRELNWRTPFMGMCSMLCVRYPYRRCSYCSVIMHGWLRLTVFTTILHVVLLLC